MNNTVMQWLEHHIGTKGLDCSDYKVLEIGSYDVNGSARNLFKLADYWGIDMEPGPGVDEVITPERCLIPYNHKFDVIVCTEMLEHDPFPNMTFFCIPQLLKKGGYLLLTCRGFTKNNTVQTINDREVQTTRLVNYGYHADMHFKDYWRFSIDGIYHLATSYHLTIEELKEDPDPNSPGIFLLARNL